MSAFIEPPNIASSTIKAFFTTKRIVCNHERVDDALAEKFQISMDNIYMPVQKHTNIVHVLGSETAPVVADAVVTDKKNMFIGVVVADCVPILMYDRNTEVIAAVHAGWRGTAKRIIAETIRTMQERYSSSSEYISVAIGPSIRQCSYEVDEHVTNEVSRATGDGDYYLQRGNKYFIDLSTANKIQALNMGIPEDNIWQSDACTFCNPAEFHSYRYSKGTAGRQGGFIGMW